MTRSARALRLILALAAFAGTLLTFPGWWCGRDAGAWFAGDFERQRDLARAVGAQIGGGLGAKDFFTGSGLFSGEWLFGTYLMAGIGFCQLVQAHPETGQEFAPHIERCIAEIASPRIAEFDTRSWDRAALEDLDGERGHAAYLGYFNFLLGLYREIAPGNRFVALNDRITRALERRFAASPNGFIETYPGEWYPVDNAPALASLALRRNFATASRGAPIDGWIENYRRRAVDPATGLLIQALTPAGAPADAPRGSGTALAAFFFRRDLAPIGRELYAALRRELAVELAGFGAMREYPRGQTGRGDIDSGPMVWGLGFSASGFALGGARIHGDAVGFRRLWASAQFGGAPVTMEGRRQFVTAGPLGNAILLAMVTAKTEASP